MRTFVCALFAAAALLVVAADPKETKADKGSVTDQMFVTKASAGGMAEVNHGTMAARMASSADVKKFGMQMVTDHTKANKELLALADKKRLKPAERMDAKHQMMARKLAGLKGAEFDRAYMQGQVMDHEETIALFEAKAKGEGDDALKAWAKEKLPTIREHLKMAQMIHKRLGEGTR